MSAGVAEGMFAELGDGEDTASKPVAERSDEVAGWLVGRWFAESQEQLVVCTRITGI